MSPVILFGALVHTGEKKLLVFRVEALLIRLGLRTFAQAIGLGLCEFGWVVLLGVQNGPQNVGLPQAHMTLNQEVEQMVGAGGLEAF